MALKSHTSQMAQSILHQLVWALSLPNSAVTWSPISCDAKKYIICHTQGFFFIIINKRGPAINQSCNHPCNHINHSPQPYLRHLVHECWGPRWEVLRFQIWFCILFLQCASEIVAARFNKCNCLLWLEKNVQKILLKATFIKIPLFCFCWNWQWCLFVQKIKLIFFLGSNTKQ